jgi:hypothetical protein
MPDIFDQLDAPAVTAAKPDVFDEVASSGPGTGDIFDEVSSAGGTPTALSLSPARKIPASNEERGAADFSALQKAGALPQYEGQSITEPLVKVAKSVTGQQVEDAFDYLNQKWAGFVAPKMGVPLSDQEKQEVVGSRSEPPATAAKVTAGAQNVAAGAANAFTSPLGIATLGQGALPQLAQRLISLGFAVDMGRHLPEAAQAAGAASVSGDAQEKTEAFGSLVVDAALITSLAKHGLTVEGKVPAEKQAAVLDDLAKTLKETAGLKKEPAAESSPLAEEPLPRAEKPLPQDVFDEIAPGTAGETHGSTLPGEKLLEEIRASAVPVKPATVEIEGQPGQQKLDAKALLDLQAAMRGNQVAEVPSSKLQAPEKIQTPEMSIPATSNEVAKTDMGNKVEPAPETSTSLNEGKASEMLAEPVQRSSEASGDEPPAKVAGTSPGASLIPEAPATSAGASSVSEPAQSVSEPAQSVSSPAKAVSDSPELIQARNKLESLRQAGKGQSDQAFRLIARIAKLEEPKKVARGITGRARFDSETNAHGPDVLSWIKETMPLLSKHQARALWGREKFEANKSQWDDAPQNLSAPHHNVIYGGVNAPNRVAQEAFEAGVIPAPTPEALWTAIRGASEGRLRNNARTKREAVFLKEEIRQHEAWMKATAAGETRVSVDQLKPGDLFEVDGERIEVADVNPDTGDVTLKDGRKFGPEIHVESGQSLHVEKFEAAPDAKFAAGDFSFDQPESVNEAKTREKREALVEKEKQAKARMFERAGQRLTGEDVDTTKEMFGSEPETRRDKAGQGSLFASGERRSITPEQATHEILSHLGLESLPEKIRVIHDASLPWGARITGREQITVNAAQIRAGNVVPKLLEEGLHGVWHSPEVQTAWQRYKASVTEAEIAGEATNRRSQGLPTDRETIHEEAAIAKLLAEPGKPLVTRLLNALAEALYKVFGIDLRGEREQLLGAAAKFLRGDSDAPGPTDHIYALADSSSVKWEDLKEQVAQAEKDLRAAIKAPAPDETAAAKSVREKRKNLATAKFREAEDLLYSHPEYLKHLYELQSDAVTRLRQIKEESGGAPDSTPEAGVVPEELRFKLQGKIEEIDAELQRFPVKMRNSVYNELYGEPESALKTESDKGIEAGELSERNPEPVDEEPELPEGKLQRAIAELPGHARELFRSAKELKTKLAQIIKRSPNRDVISYTKDAADNRANIFGRQAANLVLHETNRAFGEKDVNARDSRREMALTFVIESGRDRAALDDFKTQLRGSEFRNSLWAKRALDAINFAQKHWERFTPAADLYEKITDAQVASENASGIATLHRSGGYVFHLNDVLDEWAALDVGGGGGPSAPFKHIRDYPTYAQSLTAGVTPKTLNAVDLLHRRLTLGRKLINYRAWSESMSDLVDTTTQLPIVADAVVRVRKDGTSDITAPPGYFLTDFAGQKFAIHRGYDGLLDDLTAASKFGKGTVLPVLMKAAATTKHLMLLFDTYHLGRLAFWNGVTRGGALPGNPFAYKKGITLLDNTSDDIQQMARNGEIPKDWETGLLEQKRQLEGLLKAGLNVGSARDNVYADWIHNIPVTGKFNHWLFDQFQRGAMSEAALIELGRARSMYPKLTEAEVMRRVAKDVNIRFGNLASQSWIKSKTFQDLARVVFLAPQWNESLIRAEFGALKQIGLAPVESFQNKRLAIGTLGRSVGTAALGLFIANQIINYITRGHPTWENEEEGFGAKISAYIPDVAGHGPGLFHNPLVLPAEISHLLMEKTERSGDPTQAGKEFTAGRLGTVGRLIYTPLVREDEMGAKLRGGMEVGGQMLKQSVPVPISAGAGYRLGKQLITGEHEELYPGQFEKQAFQTFGVKTQGAPDAERRIQALAADFKKEKGIKPNAEFFHGDYYFLDRAARIGNVREMKKEMEALLEKKKPADIRKHYLTWARSPFSGSRPREVEFKATLTPEQLKVYERALEKRQQLRERVLQFLP